MGACACTICWEIIGDAKRRGGDAMRGGGDADLSHHLCVASFIMQMMNLQGTYPTKREKENHRLKHDLGGDMFVPKRVRVESCLMKGFFPARNAC